MNAQPGPSPTTGLPGGEHRVLEPPGAEPLEATRLDALADLWDGEVRLELDAIVLSRHGHGREVERIGPDPHRLAAAFVESVAERGGLGPAGRDATLIGTVAAVGSAHPHPVRVGERVAVTLGAGAIPTFATPTHWDGGPVVPVQGHAIVPAAGVTVPVGTRPAAEAALLARHADLPASLGPGARVAVIGLDRPAGVIATAVAASQLRTVTAAVGSLGGARLARALGADRTAVVAADEPVSGAAHLLAVAGGRLDLVVLADPAAAALAARCSPTVQVVTDPTSDPDVAAHVVAAASAAGRGVAVHAGRGVARDRGAELHRLIERHPLLAATLAWMAGTGGRPEVPSDETEAM